MKTAAFLALLLAPTTWLAAQSTINATQKYAWSANTAWINLRPSAADGVAVGAYICSGQAWGANIGWIAFGDGTPVDKIRYSNTDSSDFGVNVQSGGLLRGLAYGANVGWIQFEATGNPRINLTNGALSGFAYGANIGWINLGDLTFQLVTDSMQSGADTDNDGIPDAWEYQRTGGLGFLSATGDFDHDGISDLAEYQADTNPLSGTETFAIAQPQAVKQPNGNVQFTLTWRSSPDRLYIIEHTTDLATVPWTDSGLGTITADAGTTTTRTITEPSAARRFYRARVVLPLSP